MGQAKIYCRHECSTENQDKDIEEEGSKVN